MASSGDATEYAAPSREVKVVVGGDVMLHIISGGKDRASSRRLLLSTASREHQHSIKSLRIGQDRFALARCRIAGGDIGRQIDPVGIPEARAVLHAIGLA